MFLGCLILVTTLEIVNVPVDALEGWTESEYRRVPPNEVSVQDGALHIAIGRSSSPLVYKLETPKRVKAFTVTATWNGELDIPADAVQGSENSDDFVLKVGLVEAGDRTLNWFQRRVAADWILELHELAPEGNGVRRINFYSTTQQADQVGTSRHHPLSDLLYEERVLYLPEPGRFQLSRRFEEPIETLGLWISSDGDDTGSEFTLAIEQIELEVVQ
ncbi:MAG: hypothetical protein WD448_01760 [Woeseia sp.]